ncbi:MAG: redoxin domain-containing protein [Gemmatimonadota bacterium]|nr:MAG: redoxin domain-containing protein [Gemmatimonadota bacterium]
MRLVSRLPDTTCWIWLFPTLLLVGLGVPVAQPLSGQDEADKAAAKLRHAYMMRDYEHAVTKDKQLIAGHPEAREARAWYVLNLARNNDVDEAIEYAESMVTTDPGEMWGLFALAGALNWHSDRGEEALELSEKALATAPDHIDFIWLRMEVLRKQDGPAAALGFFDQLPPDVQRHPDVLIRKAVAQHFLWSELEPDERRAQPDECFATFEQVRALDSMNVEAYYLAGAYQLGGDNDDEARALLAHAASLTAAPDVHQYYWRSIQARRDMSLEQKQAVVDSAIGVLVALRPDQPGVLNAAIGMYGQLKLDDKKLALEERVLADYPDSKAAEWVLVNRYRAVGSEFTETERTTGTKDSAKIEEYKRMVTEFIERPHHLQENLLGGAYRDLFMVVKDDSTIDGDYLYSLVDGMVKYEGMNIHIVYGQGAVALADHETHLEDAERLAQEGMVKAVEMMEGRRDSPIFESEEEFERSLGYYKSMMADALGWVYFKAGEFEKAEEELNRAFEFSSEGLTNLYHLGQYHEAMAEQASAAGGAAGTQEHLDRAEEFYIKGIAVQTFGDNPSDEALKTLYVKRNGSDEGYDAYLENAEDLDRGRRKAKIIEDRIAEPDTIMPFSLEALDSSTVSYDELRGKIVVINFWGVWCGPCVIEMPELQKLHEQYEADPDVVFLTIDYNDEPEHVREWIAKREYTFPVLLDDGYVSDVDVRAFPTTWFIDRDGFIVYVKRGASEKVHEEFSWRIEALREEGGGKR